MKKNVVSKPARSRTSPRPRQVYLSYAFADHKKARQIADAIRASGCRVWDWNEEVGPGDNLPVAIGKALEASDAMVVLVSPEAMRTGNINLEVGYALGSGNYAHKVIPVRIKSTPDAPWILKKFKYIPWGADVSDQVLQRLGAQANAAT